MAEAGKERRAHARAPLEVEAWVASDGARLNAATQDLSLGGVRVRGLAEWTTGDQVLLQLTLPRDEGLLEVSAHVAWQREEWLGLAFFDLDERTERTLQRVVNAALGLEPGGVDDEADAFEEGASATVEVGTLKS